MNLSKIFRKIKIYHNLYIKEKIYIKRKSYSMDKEDIEICKFFKNKKNGFYVDVGSFHPTRLSNTYFLYKLGWRGINIDPSEYSIALFNYLRKEDINICKAASIETGLKKFYYQKEFSPLSTLNLNTAKKRFQGKVKEKLVNCDTLKNIIDSTKYKNQTIDFLNIDTEGKDIDALKSLNIQLYKPKLVCVEDFKPNIKYDEISAFEILKSYKYEHFWSGVYSHIFFKR